MLAHFIQHRGKGPWVVALPMLLASILFVIADSLSLNDKYIGAITLLVSGIILFAMDNRREKITQGDIIIRSVIMPRVKGRNTLMWIEVRYWAIIAGATGGVWLISLL